MKRNLFSLKYFIDNQYPGCLVYLRGDFNCNINNHARRKLEEQFCSTHSYIKINIPHKTYHHFVGEGTFDSNVDVIMHSKTVPHSETLNDIFCKNDFPIIQSHHDIILTSFILPSTEPVPPAENLIEAPRVNLSRVRIDWSEEGITNYQDELSNQLYKARINWLHPSSKSSTSMLINLTNEILQRAASSTNSAIPLNTTFKPNSFKLPAVVRKSENKLNNAHKRLKKAKQNKENITEKLRFMKESRNEYRKTVRNFNHLHYYKESESLYAILTSNPAVTYRSIRSSKRSSASQIPFLTVGSKKYVGGQVIDGMFESLSNL